jgi:hypothetical protein
MATWRILVFKEKSAQASLPGALGGNFDFRYGGRTADLHIKLNLWSPV